MQHKIILIIRREYLSRIRKRSFIVMGLLGPLIMAGVTTLQSLNFRTTFDVYATPKMFLLDRDKKVIAKQVGAEQISEILMRMEAEKARQ